MGEFDWKETAKEWCLCVKIVDGVKERGRLLKRSADVIFEKLVESSKSLEIDTFDAVATYDLLIKMVMESDEWDYDNNHYNPIRAEYTVLIYYRKADAWRKVTIRRTKNETL